MVNDTGIATCLNAADGSVILQTPASMLMIYPHIYKNLAYNAFTDVTAVSQACTFDFGGSAGKQRGVAIEEVNRRAGRGELSRDLEAKATGTAGDEDTLAGEFGFRGSHV